MRVGALQSHQHLIQRNTSRTVPCRNLPSRIATAHSHCARARASTCGSSPLAASRSRGTFTLSTIGRRQSHALCRSGSCRCTRCGRLHNINGCTCSCRRIQQQRKIADDVTTAITGLQHHIHKRFIDRSVTGQYQHRAAVRHFAHTGANPFSRRTVFQPFLRIGGSGCCASTQIAGIGINQLHFGAQRLPQRRLHSHPTKTQSVRFGANTSSDQCRYHGDTWLCQDALC